MKKIILFFSLLIFISLVVIILFVHTDPVKFNTITLEEKFSISIPEYLFRTDSIDRNALIQYKNEKKQLFLLAYEKKDTLRSSLEVLFKNASDDLISKIGNAQLIKYYPKKINLHKAVIGNIRGAVNETGVYYRIAIIADSSRYYEIIAGTTENNLSNFSQDIDSMLDSFTPLLLK